MHGDGEFNIDDLKDQISPTEAVIYGRNEHVAVAERSIRTIKERCRITCRAAPYVKYTAVMIQHLVESRVSWLNRFPSKNGVCKHMSPATIVLGHEKPDMTVKRIPFGGYALTYTQTSNDMKARGTPGIALSESNQKGGQYFMSLYTGKVIHAYAWQELPIHEEVIEKVEYLADLENQPKMTDRVPLFEWAPGVEITDESEQPQQEHDIEEIKDEPIEEDEQENIVTDDDDSTEHDSDISFDAEDEDPQKDEVNHEHDEDQQANPLENEDFLVNEDEEGEPGDAESQERDSHEENLRPRRENAGQGVERFEPRFNDKTYEITRKRQYLQFKRKKKRVQLAHVHNLMTKVRSDINAPSYLRRAVDVIFTQLEEDEKKFKDMPAHKGMKLFGERAVAACMKEFSQLAHGVMPGKPVIVAVNNKDLTAEDRMKALEAVNLIKQKRCGKVKFRSCADGSNQWKYLREDENISSPTLQLESLFISLIIDVLENRDVAIFDIPGAYLHAEMPEDKMVLIKFRGQFAEIMCKVDPSHQNNIVYEKGKKVLYVRVVRAIYGCIESAMLWYNLYVSTLKELGFTLNPYDKCVANKLVNGTQCTMAWYVDDNKLSHKDPKVVDALLQEMTNRFGELTVTRGDEHTFLGMKLKIDRIKKFFTVDMTDQIEETIQAFGESIDGEVASPAAKYLFNVPENDEEIDDEREERFHTVVAKLLYIMKRARPDLEPSVAFLCTRVSKCGSSDWKKLRRVLQYAKQTLHDHRVIGASSFNDVFTFVDASYGVYDNMRGVTGGCMSMGRGVFHARSSKQKLNTKSSTETELVGVSEYLPFNIWAMQFLHEQGYEVKTNTLFQDNQGAMLMERNGRNSCTGNSRHINIRYFFCERQN